MEQMEDCTNGIWKYQMRPEINKVIRLSMRIVRSRKEKKSERRDNNDDNKMIFLIKTVNCLILLNELKS